MDAYKKCTNRCFISITRLTPLPQNVIIKEYFSNDDLLECLLASSSIPFFTESNITGFYRGSRVVDGGITNNCPIFYDFADRVAPYAAHLHLGDASGVNGEGLQIGSGEIDFASLSKSLRAGCPEASFIPEIWQGHKNRGEGFWLAMDRLNSLL